MLYVILFPLLSLVNPKKHRFPDSKKPTNEKDQIKPCALYVYYLHTTVYNMIIPIPRKEATRTTKVLRPAGGVRQEPAFGLSLELLFSPVLVPVDPRALPAVPPAASTILEQVELSDVGVATLA